MSPDYVEAKSKSPDFYILCKYNILKQKKTQQLVPFLFLNMPARGRLLARRSLETSPNSKLTAYAQRGFNDKIKALRKAANMNQQELADKIHIHVTHLSKMENGYLLPSIDIVQRLMKVFAVSADNFARIERGRNRDTVNFLTHAITSTILTGMV